MSTPQKKQKRQVQDWEDQIERLRGIPGGAVSMMKDEAAETAKGMWEQMLGIQKASEKVSGDLKAGEAWNLSATQSSTYEKVDESFEDTYKEAPLPGLDYHRQFSAVRETHIVSENTRDLQVRINQIISELRKLTSASEELSVQFVDVAMEETPEAPGVYHINFFEWVFSVIQKARERIEESQTWLAAFQSKKKQKGYWNMFKKHGTTFGLSNERVVATQTG